MKKVNISEDKLKKALREIFKEEMYQSNQEPFADQTKKKELEMGVGDDGTVNHELQKDFKSETRDKNFYPGFNEMV